MTIAQIGDLKNKTAARKSDRGGNIMNFVSEVFLKLDYSEKAKKHKATADEKIDDYGYTLYNSIEYDFKYLKNDDFGFRGNLLNTIRR